MYVCMYVCVYVCTYVCLYLYRQPQLKNSTLPFSQKILTIKTFIANILHPILPLPLPFLCFLTFPFSLFFLPSFIPPPSFPPPFLSLSFSLPFPYPSGECLCGHPPVSGGKIETVQGGALSSQLCHTNQLPGAAEYLCKAGTNQGI